MPMLSVSERDGAVTAGINSQIALHAHSKYDFGEKFGRLLLYSRDYTTMRRNATIKKES